MPTPIDQLAHAFAKLPGIGQKTALRLAFYVIRTPAAYAHELAQALLRVKEAMQLCHVCLAPAAQNPCALCLDPRRDHERICVVEEPADVGAIERSGAYRGMYHILHGALSPLDGIAPTDLKLGELLTRLRAGPVAEVILAMNPTVEGEATATYVAQLLRPFACRVTRIASGIPLGAEVEYIDPQTLAIALNDRRPVV